MHSHTMQCSYVRIHQQFVNFAVERDLQADRARLATAEAFAAKDPLLPPLWSVHSTPVNRMPSSPPS